MRLYTINNFFPLHGGRLNMSKILLVYPEMPKDTYWGFSGALPYIGKLASMPPLGLITVAALLPKADEVRLVDLNIEKLSDDDIAWSDVVFTSSMVVQRKSLDAIVRQVGAVGKSTNRKIPLVAGGPFPTQYYDQIDGVDHFVLGEAEPLAGGLGVLDAFLTDFARGEAKRVYARPVLRRRSGERKIDENSLDLLMGFAGSDGDIVQVADRPAMAGSPIPRFDLLKINAYASMAMQMGRGCPFDCEFCTEPALNGHTLRSKTSGQFVAELEAIHATGYHGGVFVVDDNLIGNRKSVKPVLRDVADFQKHAGYPFRLYTEADIGLSVDHELMGLMRDAGFDMVFVGIESPDRDVLRSMDKGQNVRVNLLDAVRSIQSYGMEVTAGFIVGNDADPPDICDKIFDFCQEAGIPTAMAGLLIVARGSRLDERMRREGRYLNDSLGNNTHSFSLNFVPQKAVDRALEQGIPTNLENLAYRAIVDEESSRIVQNYRLLLARLYDRSGKNYYARCSVLMDHLGPSPRPARDVHMNEVKALARSLAKQTVVRPGRFEYVKFLGRTLKDHPQLFPEAVAKAIYGDHFRAITHEALRNDADYNPLMIVRHLMSEFDAFRDQLTRVYHEYAAGDVHDRVREAVDGFYQHASEKLSVLPRRYRKNLLRWYHEGLAGIQGLQPSGGSCGYSL